MSNLHPWYKKKSFATSLVDVPVRSSDDAREIEELLANGWQYQKTFVTAEDFVAKAEGDTAKHQAVITATTGDIDRDAEVVDVKGLSLKLYRKNPVIAWGHDYSIPPIGRSLWEKVDGDKLKSLVQFALRPADWQGEWFPDEVFALCQQGIVKGVSIGFFGTDVSPPTEKELRNRPDLAACRKIIRKSVLFEISIVPIGCNPHALVESVTKGLVSAKSLQERFNVAADLQAEQDLDDLFTWETKDLAPDPEPVITLPPQPTKADILRKILQSKR